MLSVSDVSLSFGKRLLFRDVNIKFLPGNCYGLIGANGSGKSTFLRILSGEQEVDTGAVTISSGMRLAVLAQNRNAYNEHSVVHAVIKGYPGLYEIMQEREMLYSKPRMTNEEGIRVAELESDFARMGGYESESEAASLLSGLGIGDDMLQKRMSELDEDVKVRVLVAQALFGNPDILLLDEPTNHLDIESIRWLEDFLLKVSNIVIVVSHDRHFLNRVCSHIADIDFGKISVYYGNYSFWQQASQLIAAQQKDRQKRAEVRAEELRRFIQRFAANASKSKQATSRMRELDKLDLESLPRSSRRFPYCSFNSERKLGKTVLELEGFSKSLDSQTLFSSWNLSTRAGDKIGFIGPNNLAKTAFMDIIAGELGLDEGKFTWGATVKFDYFPKDNSRFFSGDLSLTDWLRQYSAEQDEAYIRGFLGRMLFTQDESLKRVSVLSGGERVRCLLAKMMLSGANFLILDNPTSHLDLESITSLNNGLIDFDGSIVFASHDHQFINTIANRIIEFAPAGVIDRRMTLGEYLQSRDVAELRDEMYGGRHERLRI